MPRRSVALAVLIAVIAPAATVFAAGYTVTPLISDPLGSAPVKDPNLQNGWGITSTPASPFWVGSNGRGVATLYQTADQGKTFTVNSRVVAIPAGATTGTIFNSFGTGNFNIATTTTPAASTFLFVTENGHISGWNATTAVNNVAEDGFFDATAVYKGMTLGVAPVSGVTSNLLYATDFRNNKIRVLNSSFAPVTLAGNFTDPNLPAGFAPFNIANINNTLYVTYAKQDDTAHDDVAGTGFIDTYSTDGTFQSRLVSGGALNSPWGMVLAPANFGPFSNDLLVGNFGNGAINAFNPTTGAFLGSLSDNSNNPLAIDGLWGLSFGNGAAAGPTTTLFFTAGPNGEAQGLFGSISVPEPSALLLLAMPGLLAVGRRKSRRV